MNTSNSMKLKTLVKNSILVVIAAFSLYICDASAHVTIGFSFGPAFYPQPYPDVVWVPSHWENGYYVPGQYVQYGSDYDDGYYGPSYAPGNVWFGFGGGGGHWHHGGGWGGGGHRR